MQLPPDDEIVMVAGVPPIRAKKARYFEDPRLAERILPPPKPAEQSASRSPTTGPRSRPLRSVAPGKGSRRARRVGHRHPQRPARQTTIRPMPACAASPASNGTRISRRSRSSRRSTSSSRIATTRRRCDATPRARRNVRQVARQVCHGSSATAWSSEMEKKIRVSPSISIRT